MVTGNEPLLRYVTESPSRMGMGHCHLLPRHVRHDRLVAVVRGSRKRTQIRGQNARSEREPVKLQGSGKLLRVFVGESDHYHGQPLCVAIVERARREGLSGATVFKGIEGYGGHSIVHAARVFDLSHDLPMLIEIVDTEEKIRAFIPLLDEMMDDGLVTLETVDVIRYNTGSPKA